MSNTEPTEEQWQAARTISDGHKRFPVCTLTGIARLLAEREAKLREELARWRSLVEFHKNNADIQQAEIAKFQRRNAEYERRKAKLDHDVEAYERGRAQSALLSALPLPSDVVAKLLERDTLREEVARLREELATLNANNDQLVRDLKQGGFCYPASNVARFIVHDRLESSGDWYDPATRRILHMDPAKAFAMKDESDTLRARVAELEATTNSAWVRMAAAESAASNYEEMLEEAQKREAQHLADIRALRGFLRVVDEDYDHDEDAHRYGTACRCCMANHLRHRLAHYDDAKADAGAVDWQAWANGSCPEPGCSLANPHEQGVACVKPTAEGGEG